MNGLRYSSNDGVDENGNLQIYPISYNILSIMGGEGCYSDEQDYCERCNKQKGYSNACNSCKINICYNCLKWCGNIYKCDQCTNLQDLIYHFYTKNIDILREEDLNVPRGIKKILEQMLQ